MKGIQWAARQLSVGYQETLWLGAAGKMAVDVVLEVERVIY